jgi:hypothetical protein
MSKINKLTQLIIKITHRSEQTDDETSACQENNVDSLSKKSKPKISLLLKRLLWCLMGIALLIGGYFWWRMPVRMRVVAMIPFDVNYEQSLWTPFGLCRWCWTTNNTVPSIVSLYGWDNQLIWSKQGPKVLSSRTSLNSRLSSSVDGHITAVCIIEKEKLHVMSWRDGNLISDLFLPVEKTLLIKNRFSIDMSVSNSGRVWIYNTMYRQKYCNIWTVIGDTAASGRIPLPSSIFLVQLSPDNDLLYFQQKKPLAMHYLYLCIKGNKVGYSNEIIHRGAKYLSVFCWDLEETKSGLCNFNGTKITNLGLYYSLLNDNILLSYSNYNQNTQPVNIYNRQSGEKWNIYSQHPYVWAASGTPDGKYILAFEQGCPKYLQFIVDKLSRNDKIALYFQQYVDIDAQMVLYAQPGNPIAVFPAKSSSYLKYINLEFSGKSYRVSGFVLSPNGNNVGLLCDIDNDGEYYHVILGR